MKIQNMFVDDINRKINGVSWVSTRDTFAFFEDDVVETLMEVLGSG